MGGFWVLDPMPKTNHKFEQRFGFFNLSPEKKLTIKCTYFGT